MGGEGEIGTVRKIDRRERDGKRDKVSKSSDKRRKEERGVNMMKGGGVYCAVTMALGTLPFLAVKHSLQKRLESHCRIHWTPTSRKRPLD